MLFIGTFHFRCSFSGWKLLWFLSIEPGGKGAKMQKKQKLHKIFLSVLQILFLMPSFIFLDESNVNSGIAYRFIHKQHQMFVTWSLSLYLQTYVSLCHMWICIMNALSNNLSYMTWHIFSHRKTGCVFPTMFNHCSEVVRIRFWKFVINIFKWVLPKTIPRSLLSVKCSLGSCICMLDATET